MELVASTLSRAITRYQSVPATACALSNFGAPASSTSSGVEALASDASASAFSDAATSVTGLSISLDSLHRAVSHDGIRGGAGQRQGTDHGSRGDEQNTGAKGGHRGYWRVRMDVRGHILALRRTREEILFCDTANRIYVWCAPASKGADLPASDRSQEAFSLETILGWRGDSKFAERRYPSSCVQLRTSIRPDRVH